MNEQMVKLNNNTDNIIQISTVKIVGLKSTMHEIKTLLNELNQRMKMKKKNKHH